MTTLSYTPSCVNNIIIFIFSPLVLPPVLVPRNPQVISSRYEPVPSYIDTQRPTCSPNHYHPFELPGKQFVLLLVYITASPETPPPAYSETGSPSPPDASIMDQQLPTPGGIVVIMITTLYFDNKSLSF